MTSPRALIFAFLACAFWACQSPPDAQAEHAGWHMEDMDLSVDPGQDFYRYVNGAWLESNPIPAAYGSWGVAHEVMERNQSILKSILEDAAGESDAQPGSTTQLLGDFFASGMDLERIEAAGLRPLAEELALIEAVQSKAQLPAFIGRLNTAGVAAPFGIASESSFENSQMMIAMLIQAGLGLPDRDYYLREGEEAEVLRQQYREHLAAMFGHLGESPDAAAGAAERVFALERRLAEISLSSVELRVISNLANWRSLGELQAMTPSFAWSEYFQAIGLEELDGVNLIAPRFFEGLEVLLQETDLADWKFLFRWHLLDSYADYLPKAIVDDNFAFFGKTLTGAEELPPRWKKVLQTINGGTGELLGQAFVKEAFSASAKSRAERMVQDLLAAFRQRLLTREWMSEETRQKALQKLEAFRYKIGYPDVWRSYEGLELDRSSYAANVMRVNRFDFAFQMAKVGKEVDPNEWGMAPQEVNAYYHPLRNEIVFPAGILQPPFFSNAQDDALNYGAMGTVIGHEITHGFDDQGSQFDAEGNLNNWWTESDSQEFQARAQVLVDQFNGYQAIDDLHVNGQLTLGENIADLGGLIMAYHALMNRLGEDADKKLDGFTPAQRFFLAYGRTWRANIRDEALKLQVNTDPHSPAYFRCIGPLSNTEAFAEAFGLPSDSPMMRPQESRASIW